MNDAYIVDAVRTPIGRHGGALASVRPDDLAAVAVKAVVERNPQLDPASIDEVYLGDANGAGEDNRNVARMAALLAGLPVTVPGATVNRLCGSGLEAVIAGSRAVAVGDASVVLAGGVESMTRAPWVLLKPDRAYPTSHQELWSSALGWRMVNPRMPAEWTIALGEGAEVLADKYGISREAQDAFAVASHQKADAAWSAGWFDAEVVAVPGADLDRDECIRPDSSLERLARLEAGVPVRGHGDGGQLLAAERRRRGRPPRLGGRLLGDGRHAAGQGRRPGDERRRAAAVRHRAGDGRPCRTRPRRARLGRPRRRRAQRGVRRPEPRLPRRVDRARPCDRQPARAARSPSGTRSAAPAPASSRHWPTTCAAPAAGTAWPPCASASARGSPS